MFRVITNKDNGTKISNISDEDTVKIVSPKLAKLLRQKKLLSTTVSKSYSVMYTFLYIHNA